MRVAPVIGVMTGLGAVAFRALIGFAHNALYNGRRALSTMPTFRRRPSVFGAWLFFSPVIGGLIVV